MLADSRRRRVLVVDDEPDVREVMGAVLVAEGYDVVTVPDGATALQEAHATTFDLAVTDLRMPGLSGRETLAELRRRLPGLPVVVLSAYVTPADAEACRALGAFAILRKPFTFERLLHTVRQAELQR